MVRDVMHVIQKIDLYIDRSEVEVNVRGHVDYNEAALPTQVH